MVVSFLFHYDDEAKASGIRNLVLFISQRGWIDERNCCYGKLVEQRFSDGMRYSSSNLGNF